MTLQVEKGLLTIEEYCRMVEAGLLGSDDRVELIRGEIVRMAPVGDFHIISVNRFTFGFSQSAGYGAIVSVQNPIKLTELHSAPQPDVTLFRYKPNFYADGSPTVADILLVVEVAASSLTYDLDVKIPLYAEAGVPEVWIMALDRGWIERFSGLAGGEYRNVRRFRPGESISPELLPNVRLDVGWLFGVE